MPVALGAVAFAGCLPGYTFGETRSDAGGDDATMASPDGGGPGPGADGALQPQGDASSDSPGDAPVISQPPPDASTVPFSIASAGSKVFATGFGEELHFFYAQHDQRYWLFFADDTAATIQTRSSMDQVTWTPGSVSLAGGGSVTDGNDFSVAYADVGGKDVVHIIANVVSQGEPRLATIHVRGTLSGGQFHLTDTVTVPDTTDNGAAGSAGDTCSVDAPSTTVAADGHVYDVTAWTGHPNTTCDTNIYRSTGVDNGTTWAAPGFDHDGYYVSLPAFAFSHELLTLPEAGVVLAAWPDQDNQSQTTFDEMGWALSSSFQFDSGAIGTTGTFPPTSAELFYNLGSTNSYDDWALCRLSDTEVHAVRHVMASLGALPEAYQEVRFDGIRWTNTGAPPSLKSISNTGVVLLGDGNASHGMLLVGVALDNSIHISRWTSTAGWTTLPSIPAGTLDRQSLGGSGCGSPHPHVFWTEGSGPYTVMGIDLSNLLTP